MKKSRLLWLGATLFSTTPLMADIAGTYVTRCIATDGGTAKRKLQFSASQLNDVQTVYDDTYCVKANVEITVAGPYKLDGFGKNLDFRTDSVTIKPLNSTVAGYFEDESFCGMSGWTAGIAFNVTGLTCGPSFVADSGSKLFTVIREVNGSSFHAIQLGLTDFAHNGSSPAERPEKYDPQLFYPQ